MSRAIMLIIATFGLGLSSCSTEPKNYAECIEKNIKNANTDVSARVVTQMCRERFPKTYTDEEVFGQQKYISEEEFMRSK